MRSFAKYLTVMLFISCGHEKELKTVINPRHLIEMHQKGIGSVFVDMIPNKSIMISPDSDSRKFSTFLVSFTDSTNIISKQQILARSKYYQYEMQYDWIAIVNEDSLRPVLFQPKVKLNANLDEFVIVFELRSELQPDTLIYKDSYGTWGVQKIIFQ